MGMGFRLSSNHVYSLVPLHFFPHFPLLKRKQNPNKTPLWSPCSLFPEPKPLKKSEQTQLSSSMG